MCRYAVLLILMIPTIFSAAEKERSALAQTLFDTYKPTYDACRPPVRMGKTGPEVDRTSLVATTDSLPLAACMIAGFKDVVLIGYRKMSADLLKVFKEYGIGYIIINASRIGKPGMTPELILYTPKGKNNAMLLVKVKEMGARFNSAYLVGLFLGYPEDDIKAYYQRSNFSTFESDKKQSQAWIEANSKDIERWIAENSVKHDLLLGDFNEAPKLFSVQG